MFLKNATRTTRLLSALGLALSGAYAATATAQDTVTLRVADWMPTSHHVSSEGGVVFMEKAKELSKGRIQFSYFPAEQLGKAKDSLQLTQTGVADMANIAPAYITDKFPLAGVAELPGIYEGACKGSHALAKMTSPGNILYENEFGPNGVRVLFTAAIGAYRPMTATRKVERAADFAGLKMRTAGGPMDQTAALLGAASIKMAGPEVLVSLSRGTLDGLFWPILSVQPWGMQAVLKYWTPNISVGSFVSYWVISEKAWSKLPKDVQDILIEAGDYATQKHCDFVDQTEGDEIEALKKMNIVPVPLPDDEARAITQSYGKIYTDWAASLDGRSRPGTTVLQAFQAEVAK